MPPAASLSGPILIVEDEAVVAADIEERLNRMGYATMGTAATGVEALALASETKPLLALMDIRLQGDMDGIMVADALRRDMDVPVVFLTAHADRATLERAKITESFGYVLKPFDERTLEITISMAIYKHTMETGRKRLASDLEDARADIKILSGLLTACSYCRKIEDEAGDWVSLENYVERRSEATFSHSYCPDCLRVAFPQHAEQVLKNVAKIKKQPEKQNPQPE